MEKRFPLRKCLQCHVMKREDFHDRCQACYDENKQECQRQREAGKRFPLDRNLIGWYQATSQPGLNDYLWYFLKWCFTQRKQDNTGEVIAGTWGSDTLRIGTSIGRYYPDTDTWELAPYVKDEYEEIPNAFKGI